MVKQMSVALLAAGMILLQSCGIILRGRLNREFPPVSGLERKVEALEKQTESLARMSKPDFGFQINKDVVQQQINSLMREQLQLAPSDLGDELDSIIVDDVTLEFQKQEIAVKTTITLNFNHRKIKMVRANVNGFISPYVYHDTLTFIPVLKELRVQKVKLKGIFKSLTILKPLLNGLLRRYLDNVNGQMRFYHIPLPKDVLPATKVSELLSGSPDITIVNDFTVDFKREIGPVAILIDDDGLQLIGEMVLPASEGGDPAKTIHDKLLADRDGDLPVANEFAERRLQLLETQDSVWLATKQSLSIYQTETQAEKISQVPEIDSAMLGSVPVDFQKLFERFGYRFNEYWSSSIDAPAGPRATVFSFSKYFISRTVNELLHEPNLVIQYKIPQFNKPIPKQHFEIVKKPSFNCQNVLIGCNTVNCGNRMRGCGSCDWWDAPCHLGWAACNAANVVIWTACQAENAGRLAACAIENTARFTWCTSVFLAELAAHHALNIGDLSGNIQGSGLVTASLNGLEFDGPIDHFSVNLGLQCEGDVGIKLDFDPQGLLTWLTCTFGIHTTFNSHISAVLDTKTITGTLIKDSDDNHNARATFKTDALPVHLQVTPSPVEQLLSKPEVAFGCSFVVFGVSIYSVAAPLLDFPDWKRNLTLLWEGSYDHTLDPLEFKLVFPEFNLATGPEVKAIKSDWGSHSLNFNLTDNDSQP